MASGFEVDTGTLDLVRQLAERQADHLRAIRDYLDAHTTLNDVGGLVMLCLKPKYDEGRNAAIQGFTQGVTISDAVADRAAETRTAYLDADRAAVDRLRRNGADLGIDLPAFSEPTAPRLGAGATGTGAGWELDPGVSPWSRLTPGDARPVVDGSRTLASRSANWINKPPSTVLSNFALRYPADQLLMKPGIEKVWDFVDRKFGTPMATETLHERYVANRKNAYESAYEHGHQTGSRTTNGGDVTTPSTTVRAVQSGTLVYSTVTQVRSAWNAIEGTQAATTRLDAVTDVGRGEDNTESYAWAR